MYRNLRESRRGNMDQEDIERLLNDIGDMAHPDSNIGQAVFAILGSSNDWMGDDRTVVRMRRRLIDGLELEISDLKGLVKRLRKM